MLQAAAFTGSVSRWGKILEPQRDAEDAEKN